MATTTTFLGLTLPELNEFVDSWNQPINSNFEDIDEYLSDLYDALGTNAALKGSKANLAARLDVSINPDGTLDVSGSSDILAIATSAVRGQYSDPRSRLDDGDFEIYDARQPVADGRFVPMAAVGPSDGYPPEQLDSGIALRAADFAGDSNHPICSPRIPWAPGLVTGGAVPFITAQDIGVVRLSADTIPAIFNIDGYIFRIREIIDFDWNALSPSDNDYVWIYVERLGTGYNDANFKYDGVGGGGVAAKDLRKLQSGTNGNTSTSTFTDTLTPAQFDTIPLGKIKEGDVLVIETGAAAGSYVIDALDGTTPDTKLTIKGTFKANLSGLTWHILDNAHPNIGAEVTDSAPTTQPSFEPGRVYIGRARHRSASNPEDVVVFRRGGVYDSTWIAADAATIAGTPVSLTHNLGQIPTHVEVWFRTGVTGRAYQPLVERKVVTKMDSTNFPDPLAGDTSTAVKMLFPSIRWHASNTDLTIMLANQTLDPAKGPSLYTDSGGTEVTSGQMRVIARL